MMKLITYIQNICYKAASSNSWNISGLCGKIFEDDSDTIFLGVKKVKNEFLIICDKS